jgi:rhodanese-related sulfurtransferase
VVSPALTTTEPTTVDGAPAGSRGIADILADARARLNRLSPQETLTAQRNGAILVDIRPAAQRGEHGEIPGALIIERNVLEWRLDPRSTARLSIADSYDLAVVVLCQEGYTSSLAAAALQDLGLHAATDLAGGYAAWQAAGFPVAPGPSPATPHPVTPHPVSVDQATAPHPVSVDQVTAPPQKGLS